MSDDHSTDDEEEESDRVLYMLICCVLLGLDWAESMMFLYLHVICSCIFMHAYHHHLTHS